MKTTNFAGRNSWAWVGILYCLALVFCVTFAGCGDEDIFQTISRLEKEALKYGTVSAGAARVEKYEPNSSDRAQLKTALCKKRQKLLCDPDMVPQSYGLDFDSRYFKLMLSLMGSQERLHREDGSRSFEGLSEVVHGMMKAQPPQPSEIELIRQRMAALKFIESELAELDLNSPADPNMRRLVVSLDLTAWVRGEAGAVLVYMDLYPYNADIWCDEAAEILKCWWNETRGRNRCGEWKGREHYECRWRQVTEKRLREEGAFSCLDRSGIMAMPERSDINEEQYPKEWEGFCHYWLNKKGLFPRIVQVERMGEGEYLILGEGSSSQTEFQVGGVHPVGVSGSVAMGAARKAEGVTASVRPLSLAFVAGERRAGWLFRPGRTTEGRMPPTERRLKMVVDVPKEMSKLTIHVHKAFLDGDLGILAGATFKDQMANLLEVRKTLIKTNRPSEGSEVKESERWRFPKHRRLTQTRVRNLLYQGWSEEMVVAIGAKVKER